MLLSKSNWLKKTKVPTIEQSENTQIEKIQQIINKPTIYSKLIHKRVPI